MQVIYSHCYWLKVTKLAFQWLPLVVASFISSKAVGGVSVSGFHETKQANLMQKVLLFQWGFWSIHFYASDLIKVFNLCIKSNKHYKLNKMQKYCKVLVVVWIKCLK